MVITVIHTINYLTHCKIKTNKQHIQQSVITIERKSKALSLCKMNEGESRRDESMNGFVASPLHEVTGNSHHRTYRDTIRKPPPTAEQSEQIMVQREQKMNEASSFSGGGESNGSDNDKSNASSSSVRSKTGFSNSGGSSGSDRHIVTGTGNSNSSSGDSSDRGSSSRGGAGVVSDVNNDTHQNHNHNFKQLHHAGHHGITRMEMEEITNCSNKTQADNQTIPNPMQKHNEKDIQVAIMDQNNKFPSQKNDSKKSPSDNGSDGGYAASASSNDIFDNNSSTSDSVSSNEGCRASKSRHSEKRTSVATKGSARYESRSSSSEIADFSSGASDNSDGKVAVSSPGHSSPRSYLLVDSSSDDSERSDPRSKKKTRLNNPSSPTITSERQGVAKAYKRPSSSAMIPSLLLNQAKRRKKYTSNGDRNPDAKAIAIRTKTTGLSTDVGITYNVPSSWDFIKRSIENRATSLTDLHKKLLQQQHYVNLKENYDSAMKHYKSLESSSGSSSSAESSKASALSIARSANPRQYSSTTPIYNVGVDVMAKILSYLKPIDASRVLAEPLSKTFRENFSIPQDVWKILCLSEPFYATVDKRGDGGDDSSGSYPICNGVELRHIVGKYRLLFSTFVRCVKYLDRIKDDSINGRLQVNKGNPDEQTLFKGNSSLENFFARARDVFRRDSESDISSSSLSSEGKVNENDERKDSEEGNDNAKVSGSSNKCIIMICLMDEMSTNNCIVHLIATQTTVKYGSSKLTRKLLGPVHQSGIAGNMDLPSSCAVYSIVNWMVAFADVAGIQTMCMQVLTLLLEDDQQRTTAQHAGLTDIVLRAMVLFPNNADLHTSAFHTLVLLARPIGGKEGMIFYRAMVNASGIFNIGSTTGKSGIAIMMDSMKRFSSNERLQAMSCWSMVNIALIQSQKVALVRLGGISAAGNAMMQHPTSPDVQFRALFALINLVIPSENMSPENSLETEEAIREQLDGVNHQSETDMLEESVELIANLVVVSMKNFCSNSAILNRACLVLHNLTLNAKFHNVLLWTPNCYQMIEWCIENYKQDKVLQQSARGTLQRLQMTLSNDEALRLRFSETIRAQQQSVVDSSIMQNLNIQRKDEQGEQNDS